MYEIPGVLCSKATKLYMRFLENTGLYNDPDGLAWAKTYEQDFYDLIRETESAVRSGLSNNKLDAILAELPELSVDDLLIIQKHIEALLSTATVESTGDDWLLPNILEEIKDRGLSCTIPNYFKIKKRNAYNGYLRKSEDIRNSLERSLPGLAKVQRYALGRACAKTLAEYLVKDNQFELSLDIMLRKVELIPLALEYAFPGYASGGLLPILLKPYMEWQD
jgi:hypothetical protein